MNTQKALVNAVLLIGFSGPALAAALPLISDPGGGDRVTQSEGYLVGAAFDVGSFPLQVSALGLFDAGESGLSNIHSVGIWTAEGRPLAQVDIGTGAGYFTENGYIYDALDDFLVLQPGERYIIGAYYPNSSIDSFYAIFDWAERETWSPHVSYYNTRYAPAEGFGLPSTNGGGFAYVGPNAQFAVIPESAASAMIIAASALVCALSGFRRRSGKG